MTEPTPAEMQQRRALIKQLHGLAASRIPRERLHTALHDSAEMLFGKSSLTDCTFAQLRVIENELKRMKPLTAQKVRQRSGRPARDKVTRMITPKQRTFIRVLASELGWSRSQLTGFLQTHFQADAIDALATSKTASAAINMMMGFKRKKQATERNKRYAFG